MPKKKASIKYNYVVYSRSYKRVFDSDEWMIVWQVEDRLLVLRNIKTETMICIPYDAIDYVMYVPKTEVEKQK